MGQHFRIKPSQAVEGISCAAVAAASLSVSNEGNANHINPRKDDAISEANSSKRIGSKGGWQQGLLTIGTFGNTEIDEKVGEDSEEHDQNSSSGRIPELTEFTTEEIGKLKQELTKYLALKHSCRRAGAGEKQDPPSKGGSARRSDCPLNKFLNCPSSLDVDRISSLRHACDSSSENEDPDNYYVVPTKVKDVCRADAASAGIRQRSISLLLKKMFVCEGGFTLAPSIREPQLVQSRMEKLMKAILHHKIYPQHSNSGKKLILSKSTEKTDGEEESRARESDRCKWVKTDSEFIVLEM
ncbi:hypothetical protein EJ110_NYTH55155 [Nymphaea thermarum]|nr:hypothetical protein EJ110_NYTH55155 [Nymphaea thermarum]